MQGIAKYGYVKAITGEVAVDIQIEHLIKYGVRKEHIYKGEKGETVFDAIASLRYDDDQIVVYSGAVIGKWNFKRLNKEIGPIPQTLYLCKGKITVEFSEWEKIEGLLAHIEAIERRNGGQGGKPNSISPKGHRRIHKMRDDGMNAREITEAMGYDKKRKTTVWRYMNKAINEGKE